MAMQLFQLWALPNILKSQACRLYALENNHPLGHLTGTVVRGKGGSGGSRGK